MLEVNETAEEISLTLLTVTESCTQKTDQSKKDGESPETRNEWKALILGLILIAKKVPFPDCKYTLQNLCDADYIHNHKKLINHLDNNSRQRQVGSYLVHLIHIKHVYENFEVERHCL